MWTWPDFVASVIGIAGLVWAIASSVKAGNAQRQAATATSQAAQAATDAALANKRAADALEKANELMAARMAPPPPPWSLTYEKGNDWYLHNNTGHVADAVFVVSNGGEFEQMPVAWDHISPGALAGIRAVQPFVDATLVVSWSAPDGLSRLTHPITVHFPPST